MNPETAFEFVNNQDLKQKRRTLSDLQKSIFCLAWEGERYAEISAKTNFDEGYIRQEAAKLWKILTELFEQKVSKTNFRGIVETEIQKDSDRQKFTLSQQMRQWFEILDYKFDSDNVEGIIENKRFFEWIITIKVKLMGNVRVLVRGVEGEAEICDLNALRHSVENKRTKYGWLVAVRRISKAARDEAKKPENQNLFCYTFDELIDQEAHFSGYCQWLEEQVKQRGMDVKYVPLACSKVEVDPNTKQKIGVSHYDEDDGWIDGYVDRWQGDPAKKHLSVLGEFGTGKTWFVFHYAWEQLQRYLDAKKRGVERPRLPLIILLRDYAKAVNIKSLFSEFFFRQHEIPLPGYSAFEFLNRMGKFLVIFDGFDEMAAKVDRQKMINNFWELAQTVVPGAKVILTCRTEHFPEAKEGRALLNAELQASVANLTGEPPQFEVLELKKFNDDQIRRVLSFEAEQATVEKVMSNSQLLDLARRPVMSELILEALPEIEAGKAIDLARIYLYAVKHKMERDIEQKRTFTSLADKLYFLCELSWEMLSNDKMSLNYREFPDRIRHLFGAKVEAEKDLDHWHYDMMGQTMLIRNEDGDYSPAHRSLLEFFVAYKFAAELGVLPVDFLEVAVAQSHINSQATTQEYTWSEYFRREVDARGGVISISPLKTFSRESLERLRSTFGEMSLVKAVLDLLIPMLSGEITKAQTCRKLREVVEATRGKTVEEVSYVGGNAATLLVKIDNVALEGCDLSQAVIKRADFTGASLQDVNLTEANLADSTFTGTFASVLCIAFSPDGKMFATGNANCEVRVWQADGKPLFEFKDGTAWVYSIAFSPDSKTIASGDSVGIVRLWDASTGQCLQSVHSYPVSIKLLAFTSDSSKVISCSQNGTVNFWNPSTGEQLSNLQLETNQLNSFALTSDGQTIATAAGDGLIKLWKIDSGECWQTLSGHMGAVKSLSFSPDDEILVSGGDDCNVKLWNHATGKCLQTFSGHTDTIRTVVFSPDDQILVSGGDDQSIRLWSLSSGECLQIWQEHASQVNAVNFSSDSLTLASSSNDNTIKLWDLSKQQCFKTFKGYNNAVESVAFSPDGKTLISGGDDHLVRLWQVDTGQCMQVFSAHTSILHSVTFSPDGEIIASGGEDKTVKLCRVVTFDCIQTLSKHTDLIHCVAFSSGGKTLASGSNDQTVRLWEVKTGKCLKTLQEHTNQVRSVAFSSDDRILASGSEDQTIRIWSVNTGECRQILMGHNAGVDSVAFKPNSGILASGSTDKTVKLWDTYIGKCLKILEGHSLAVLCVAFSSDGQILASSSDDSTIRLWDASTGECLKVLQEHTSWVYSVTFSPDGKTLASGSGDETIKFWNVKTGECIKTLRVPRPYENANITGVTGLNNAQKASLKALGAVEY